jgi:alpha-L-fucosidase
MGEWFYKNGEAIYGTTPTFLPEQSWGVITGKPQKLYLFLLNKSNEDRLFLKGMKSKLTKAYLLSDKSQPVAINHAGGEYALNIAGLKSDDLVKVIAVEYEGEFDYAPSRMISKSVDGSYNLTSDNATKYHSYSGKDYYTTKPTVIKLEWFIEPSDQEKYKIVFQSKPADKGKQFHVLINGRQNAVTLTGENGQVYHKNVSLNVNKFNTIQISLADQSNQHKDMDVEGLVIRLEK